MIDQRLPRVADRVVNTLMADEHPGGCLGELRNAAGLLDRHGFVGRPSWNSIRVAIRLEGDIQTKPGSGRTAGNTTLLHLPNTTSGRT